MQEYSTVCLQKLRFSVSYRGCGALGFPTTSLFPPQTLLALLSFVLLSQLWFPPTSLRNHDSAWNTEVAINVCVTVNEVYTFSEFIALPFRPVIVDYCCTRAHLA